MLIHVFVATSVGTSLLSSSSTLRNKDSYSVLPINAEFTILKKQHLEGYTPLPWLETNQNEPARMKLSYTALAAALATTAAAFA